MLRNINTIYLQKEWKMISDELLLFRDDWRSLVIEAGLTEVKSFSIKEEKAILNTFMTEYLDSDQLLNKVITVSRPWCVLALTVMTCAMKAVIAAQTKKSSSSSAMSNAAMPKTQDTKLSDSAKIFMNMPISDKEKILILIIISISDNNSQLICDFNNVNFHISVDINNISAISVLSITRQIIQLKKHVILLNISDSRVTWKMLSNSQSSFKILFHVMNFTNMKVSICSTEDLSSLWKWAETRQDNLNPETCMFDNRDWKEWCQIIHKNCDWKNDKTDEKDHSNQIDKKDYSLWQKKPNQIERRMTRLVRKIIVIRLARRMTRLTAFLPVLI